VAADEGVSPRRSKVALLRCAFASDDEREIEQYLDCARYQRRISESLRDRRAQSADGYMIEEVAGPTDPSLESIRANLPVGSVDYVIERMVEELRILRPNHVTIQTQLGDFDHATTLRQLELWGTRIIPAIRKELGSDLAFATAA